MMRGRCVMCFKRGRRLNYNEVLFKRLTMVSLLCRLGVALATASGTAFAPRDRSVSLAECPGYKASNVKMDPSTLTANLELAGPACNIFGDDLENLRLEVTYETGKYSQHILHTIIL
jgi:hypothetical protein